MQLLSPSIEKEKKTEIMSAMIVGLTGGIGSGKSAAADLFAAQGIELVDTDLLAREVVESGSTALAEIAEHFGKAKYSTHLARSIEPVYAQLFLLTPTRKRGSRGLLHPLINALMLSRFSACTGPYCLLVSPLLLETEQANAVDRILVIDVCRETQLMRTLQRDGSKEKLSRRLSTLKFHAQNDLCAQMILSAMNRI